jgi:hypothetical protein
VLSGNGLIDVDYILQRRRIDSAQEARQQPCHGERTPVFRYPLRRQSYWISMRLRISRSTHLHLRRAGKISETDESHYSHDRLVAVQSACAAQGTKSRGPRRKRCLSPSTWVFSEETRAFWLARMASCAIRARLQRSLFPLFRPPHVPSSPQSCHWSWHQSSTQEGKSWKSREKYWRRERDSNPPLRQISRLRIQKTNLSPVIPRKPLSCHRFRHQESLSLLAQRLRQAASSCNRSSRAH